MTKTQASAIYKGYFITTHWAEDGPPQGGYARWFTASFSVDPPDPCRSSWRQFPKAAFSTFLAAVANALAGAMRSIDQDISLAGGWGGRPPLAQAQPPPEPEDEAN